MASGFLPPPILEPNKPVMAYRGPGAGLVGMVNVAWVNRGGSGLARIAIAISRAATANAITAAEWVSYDRVLQQNGEFEKTGVLVFPGEFVYVRSTVASVSVRVAGVERIGNGSAVSAAPAANNIVALFTCPLFSVASGSVLLCNRVDTGAKVRIAVTTAAINAIPDTAWMTFDRALIGHGEFEKFGIVMYAGETVYFQADSGNTSARAQFSVGA
jgi:hypothetical protein